MKRTVVAAMAIVFPIVVISGDVPRGFRETTEYVQGLRATSSGFLPAVPRKKSEAKVSLRATLAGLRAVKYFGGQTGKAAMKDCRAFVQRCHDKKTGGFADSPGGKTDVFSTSIGAMAVVELGMDVDKYHPGVVKYLEKNVQSFDDIRIAAAAFELLKAESPKVRQWIQHLRKFENPDGAFGSGAGKVRMTGGAVAAVLRLGGKIEKRENIIKTLRDGQQPNGGFGKNETPFDAELGTTYRVMRTFHMLGALPKDVEGVRSFVEKCRNENGGYGPAPAERSTIATTYFAGIIHHWLKGKE